MPKKKITPPPPPPPAPSRLSPMVPLIIVTVLVVGGLLSFFLFRPTTNTNNRNTTNSVTNTTLNTNSVVTSNTNTTNTNTTTTSNWKIAAKTSSPNLLPAIWEAVTNGDHPVPTYYDLGTVTTEKYSGATVLLVMWYGEGPQFYPNTNYFLKLTSGSYVYPMRLNGGSDSDVPPASIFPQKTTVDKTYDPEFPTAPKTLKGPSAHQTLILDPSVIGLFSADNLSVAFTDPTYGPVYWYGTKTYTSAAEMIGSVPMTMRAGFYVQSPAGMIWAYHLKFDFMTKTTDAANYTGVPAITWSDGTSNITIYNASSVGGCGVTNYADVVDDVAMSALVQQGTTSTGDVIYGYKNTSTKYLLDYYNNTYQVIPPATKISYTAFVADHPIVFFKDGFGRLLRMTSDKYRVMAECGKPVVYLYPTTTTKVSVQLAPVGGFSKTVPDYGKGWNVIASPSGQLQNLADGKTYPYLFWEGRGGIYPEQAEGFIVAQADVHSFLESSLKQLGLNTVETKDFIEFWEPRMQGSPYYRVSFHGTQIMNQLAPMTISPKPDAVIRILMDYRPVSEKIEIQPQRLSHIKRTGFTVIEWGGVLR